MFFSELFGWDAKREKKKRKKGTFPKARSFSAALLKEIPLRAESSSSP
jgi:hypothetical protein